MGSSGAHRLNTIRQIAVRELRSTARVPGTYVVMTVSTIVAAVLLRSVVYAVTQNGLIVLSSPLNNPLYVSTAISATYLALLSTLSISRERDQRTLEVLFYGPVDAWGYIGGKYVEQIVAFSVMAAWHLGYFFLASSMTNFRMSSGFLLLVLMSVFVASCLVSFGIFISSLVKNARGAVAVFIGLTVLFLGSDAVHQVLTSLSGDTSGILAYTTIVASWLDRALEWVSPFAYLRRGMDAVVLQSAARYGFSVLGSLMYTAALLSLSAWLFRVRGIRE